MLRAGPRSWAWVAAAGLALGASACCTFSAPGYEGPARPHFRDGQFRNVWPEQIRRRGLGRFLRWQLNRQPGYWADQVPAKPGPPPPRRVEGSELRVTFVNHSTLLIQTQGINVLTDPVWSDTVGPTTWLSVRRRRPPGIPFEALPPIDVVVISHNHYDHLDLPTLERLRSRHNPLFVVGLGNAALLREAGIERVRELDWWKHVPITSCLNVHAVPAQHFSGRGLCDGDETLWAGYVLETCGGPIYFAGDTGLGTHFAEIRRRFGDLRLSLLPIGAYRPRWFMSAIHVDPEAAVLAHLTLRSQTSVAMHFGTFAQGDDGQDEPTDDLLHAFEQHGVSLEEFWVLDFGEGRTVPGASADEGTRARTPGAQREVGGAQQQQP